MKVLLLALLLLVQPAGPPTLELSSDHQQITVTHQRGVYWMTIIYREVKETEPTENWPDGHYTWFHSFDVLGQETVTEYDILLHELDGDFEVTARLQWWDDFNGDSNAQEEEITMATTNTVIVHGQKPVPGGVKL